MDKKSDRLPDSAELIGLRVQARYAYRFYPTGDGHWYHGVVEAVSPDGQVTVRLDAEQDGERAWERLVGRLRDEVEVKPE